MTNFLYAILGFVIAIGLLTIVHEYGHFWVARKLGVKVLRFSIGFGKRITSFYDKQGTEYAICMIPLGGYVKMLDQNEVKVEPRDLPKAFNTKPLWARALVILAGPMFNLIFAVLAYWLIFMWGVSTIAPILGSVPEHTPAYAAGLTRGMEITAIDGKKASTWEDIVVDIASHAGDNDTMQVTVNNPANNQSSKHIINLEQWTLNNNGNILEDIGLVPYDPIEPVIGATIDGYPAKEAGLMPGDRIISINSIKIISVTQMMQILRDKFDQKIDLQYKRGNELKTIELIPMRKDDSGQTIGFIGVEFTKQTLPANLLRVISYPPATALIMALNKTNDYIFLTLQFLAKMVVGKISTDHISGPIAIAQYAGMTVRAGIENFLSFLALISISLGVINLLPIPILDGGHLLFCTIEAIRGRALSIRAMNIGIVFGGVILGAVIMLAIYNDILRLLH